MTVLVIYKSYIQVTGCLSVCGSVCIKHKISLSATQVQIYFEIVPFFLLKLKWKGELPLFIVCLWSPLETQSPAKKIRMDRKFSRINSEFAKFIKKNGGGDFFVFGGLGVSPPQENSLKPPQDQQVYSLQSRIRSVEWLPRS